MHVRPPVSISRRPSSGRWLLLSALLASCMADGTKGPDTQAMDSGGDADADTDGPSDDTAQDGEVPVWTRLSAAILVEDGAGVADESTLTIELLGDEEGGYASVCAGRYAVDALTSRTPPADVVWAWWEIRPGAGDGDCEDGALPASLELGVGALHPDVASLLEAAGETAPADRLYGAYVRTSASGDLWTYGYAWTREALDNGDPAVEGPPVPDGSWRIEPVYLLPR